MSGLIDSGGIGMSVFAHTIFQNKYAMACPASGRKETWPETAARVASCVVGPYLPEYVPKVERFVRERKLMPGGRYLYAAGRPTPAISNCFLMRAHDSREGWGDLCNRTANALMMGGGIGVVYSDVRAYGILTKGLGGIATGPCSLMGIINEQGRRIMNGGSRRAAIWGGVHWWHPDIPRFITMKDWAPEVKALKEKDFNFPAEMDMTNISVILDDDFFSAYQDVRWSKTYVKWGTTWTLTHKDAQRIYWDCVRGMLSSGEPGFSIDIGEKSGENLRNAPVAAGTRVLVRRDSRDVEGEYRQVGDIVGREVHVWTRYDWVPATFTKTRENVSTVMVRMSNGRQIVCTPDHEFITETGDRVQAGRLSPGTRLMVNPPWGDAIQTSVVTVEDGIRQDVFCCDVRVEEHSFMAEGVIISNCTEATSEDDNDNCNLSSVNMARIGSRDEFEEVADTAIAFLACGTIYGALPMKQMYDVREKNRRIGLGLMGIHEWLLVRGYRYEPTRELGEWMDVYSRTGEMAQRHCGRLGIATSIASRSIAPTGSIAILAETTSGIEPIMAAAYKRRFVGGKDGKTWKAQNVVDPSAQRIVDKGVAPNDIEDSLTLAADPARRLNFQAWVQVRTDQGISSTLNVPPWGSEINNQDTVEKFGETLLEHLPGLRGMTAYPDGARGGQPITKMDYWEAVRSAGVEYVDGGEHVCRNGVCGS